MSVFHLLLVLLILILILYGLWCSTYWRRHGVQGPHGFPLVGNMLQFVLGQKHYGDVYEEIYHAYADLPYIGFYRIFNEPVILARSQDIVKEVMIRNFQNFQDNVLLIDSKRDPIMHYNPFAARSENWKKTRAEILPIFTPNKVKLSFPHIKEVCKKLENYVEQNMERNNFEAKDLFAKYTLDVVASAAFSLDAQTFTNTNSDFTTLVENFFAANPFSMQYTIALLFSRFINNLIKFRYMSVELQQWLKAIIGKILDQRLNLESSTKAAKPNDFVQWLLDAKQKMNERIDRAVIVGHAGTFLLEGFETSSSLMAFAIYEFACNPGIQELVTQEIDAVLQRYNGELCYEAVQEMSYLEAAMFETLRLHPAMAALLKQCTKSFVLPPQDTKSQAVTVREGTVVVIPVKAIHYDSTLYPEPLKFQPQRFAAEQDKQRFGCAFLGFGEGPRLCPGMRFGLTQSKAGIAALLSKYTVHLAAKSEQPLKVATTTFLTVAKDGIWINFKRRNE